MEIAMIAVGISILFLLVVLAICGMTRKMP